ncbi:MAG: fused MFS/spermidine synthase, partial [Acidobacteriota bacterium]
MEQPLTTSPSPGPTLRSTAHGAQRSTLLLVLCFLSGFSSLIYEVAWMRRLTFVFGVSAYATATVLCAFMGGLALGSWIFRRQADRARRPLRLYAGLEMGIALYALLLPAILHGLTPLYVIIHHLVHGESLLVNLARFLLAGLALLLPSTLMGATMPVLGRALVCRRNSVGADTARFYAVNTSGAVGGAFCAGFLLLGPLGTEMTTLVAVVLNVGVALAAWRMDAAAPRQEGTGPPQEDERIPAAGWPQPGPLVRLTFVVFALSGFISLAYEILWTRLLVFYLHNSTYAFSAMLVVFLLGLAAGSLAAGRLADRVRHAARTLGLVEVGIALASLVSIIIYTSLPSLATAFTRLLPVNSFLTAVLLIFFQAILILFVPTFLMGATFPLAAKVVISDVKHVGRSLGGIYAANTVGTIAGAFLCGFVLIPALGLGHTAAALVLSNLLLGAALLLATAPPTLKARTIWILAVIIGLMLPPLIVPAQLFRQAFEHRFAKVLYYRDEATDTVAVAETQPGNMDSRTIFYADGRGTAGIFSVPENRVSGHLPMLLHRDPKDVLVICFGVGNSLAAVARHPASRIHCVELSPGVIETAHFFRATNHDVLEDPLRIALERIAPAAAAPVQVLESIPRRVRHGVGHDRNVLLVRRPDT